MFLLADSFPPWSPCCTPPWWCSATAGRTSRSPTSCWSTSGLGSAPSTTLPFLCSVGRGGIPLPLLHLRLAPQRLHLPLPLLLLLRPSPLLLLLLPLRHLLLHLLLLLLPPLPLVSQLFTPIPSTSLLLQWCQDAGGCFLLLRHLHLTSQLLLLHQLHLLPWTR